MSVTAVVLAAGAARRLGRPKQLEQVGGLALVARALGAAAPADNCLVMLGSGAALIRPTVQKHMPTATISVVGDWQRGMGHVLASAVSSLPPGTDAVVVLLADQPFVTAAAVRLLIETWRATGEPWLCAGYDGRRGHPHLFDGTWFPALATLDGDDGARAVTGAHRPYVVEVPGDDTDIDDESDLVGTLVLTDRHPADVAGARVNRSATDSNSRET
ncbi:MAG: molybdenum cofactor cytidylyltransferase [Frankiales bacterium]|nr:molybdenum cofactor cytidylyltransferase [Frankiales bacterium]